MAATTLADARRVKDEARNAAAKGKAKVTGVGVIKHKGEYAVKVNVQKTAPGVLKGLPSRIDGVYVVYQVTGVIKPRGG